MDLWELRVALSSGEFALGFDGNGGGWEIISRSTNTIVATVHSAEEVVSRINELEDELNEKQMEEE